MLRPTKGNMYDFITHTWNPIKGECPHGCTYCYMKRFYTHSAQPALHLDEREMRTDLGSGHYIFVGSSCDMWAEDVPMLYVDRVLDKCCEANKNRYLMQTKNPLWMLNYLAFRLDSNARLFDNFVFCTTLETNRDTKAVCPNAPDTDERAMAMEILYNKGLRTMVTVEPIMDFDAEPFTDMIMRCHPAQVNIGADSGRNGLVEPSADKIRELIAALEGEGLKVVQKRNLKRILGGYE